MSMQINSATKELGQFASNNGYADLVEASKSDHTLKMFFDAGSADGDHVIDAICEALRNVKCNDEVGKTADGLADMIDGQDLVYITDGTHDGTEKAEDDNAEPEDTNTMPEEPEDAQEDMDKFEIRGQVVKLADRSDHKHLVFGFFSVVSISGRTIEDTQGDMIASDTLEAAAYSFVLNARTAGHMHEQDGGGEVRGIGRLVESVVLTTEKQQAMLACLHAQGITDAVLDLCSEVWWGGFLVENDDVWDKVTSGELKAFSIGGRGKRAAV